jgi:hypothetical protein
MDMFFHVECQCRLCLCAESMFAAKEERGITSWAGVIPQDPDHASSAVRSLYTLPVLGNARYSLCMENCSRETHCLTCMACTYSRNRCIPQHETT